MREMISIHDGSIALVCFAGHPNAFRAQPLIEVKGMGMGTFDTVRSPLYREQSWYSAECAQLGYLLLRQGDGRWALRQLSVGVEAGEYYRCIFFGSFPTHDRARITALRQAKRLARRVGISPEGDSLRALLERFIPESADDYDRLVMTLRAALVHSEGQGELIDYQRARMGTPKGGSPPAARRFWERVPRALR